MGYPACEFHWAKAGVNPRFCLARCAERPACEGRPMNTASECCDCTQPFTQHVGRDKIIVKVPCPCSIRLPEFESDYGYAEIRRRLQERLGAYLCCTHFGEGARMKRRYRVFIASDEERKCRMARSRARSRERNRHKGLRVCRAPGCGALVSKQSALQLCARHANYWRTRQSELPPIDPIPRDATGAYV